MKRFFGKLLKWLAIFIGIILLLLIAVAAIFEKPIAKQIIKQVNKQLKTELVVEDSKLTLIRHFPNASAELKGVKLAGSLNDELLTAETLAFRFGLFSLFDDNIKVKSILLQNGKLIIVQSNAKGKSNYDIVKSEEDVDEATEGDGSQISLSLDKAILENVELGYLDVPAGQQVRLVVKEGEISGDLSSTRFVINSKAELLSKYIELDKTRYAENKNMAYDAVIDVDLAEGKYELTDVKLEVEETKFLAKGFVQEDGEDGYDMDLQLTSTEGNLGSVLGLFPRSMFEKLQGLDSKGKFGAELLAKGKYSENDMPALKAKFEMEDGKISTDVLRHPFKDVSFIAEYSNGNKRELSSTTFALKDFRGYFDNELLDLNLTVENFDVPFVDLKMDGVLAADAIASLLNKPGITGGSGEIEFREVEIRGRFQDMIRTTRAEGVKTRGEIEFDDAALEINKKTLRLDRGKLIFNGNDYNIEDLHLEGPETDLEFKGSVKNLLPVLLADSLNSLKAELKFSGELNADKIDFNELMILSEAGGTSDNFAATQATEDSLNARTFSERKRITEFLDGSFSANVKSFVYNKIEGNNFVGNLTFNNNVLAFDGKTNAMGGEFDVKGKGYFDAAPHISLTVISTNVDVNEFFRQNEDFYQEVLTANHLRGFMDSKFSVEAYWSPSGEFLMDDLLVLADVNIKDGELRDFKMLYEYSKYVSLDDLKQIKFNTLQNWLEIKNSTIYIPVMFIQSNAMNITLSGEHTFDHDMDYYFKINAGQVLAKKISNKKLDAVPAKRGGWFNLYVHLYGNIDDYEYNTKGKEVKAHFKQTDRRKEYIKQRLMRIFGPIINLDEPVDWKDEIPEYPEEESSSEEPEYIDGF